MLKSAQPHKGIDLLDSDARLTKMGKILRATAMDELPQLINILKGQMSFVGPKPLPYLIADGEAVNFNNISEVPGFATRINVLPGLTGIAQIYAPKTISRRNKFRYDNLYIKRQSLFLDLYLIGLSILITFKGKWESKSKFSRKKGNA
jgi:lipopolysaccharide/colanic/teichoic acid biosynthesis glycosyltransferase